VLFVHVWAPLVRVFSTARDGVARVLVCGCGVARRASSGCLDATSAADGTPSGAACACVRHCVPACLRVNVHVYICMGCCATRCGGATSLVGGRPC
jgi:hypothetical protein